MAIDDERERRRARWRNRLNKPNGGRLSSISSMQADIDRRVAAMKKQMHPDCDRLGQDPYKRGEF